MSKLPLFHEKDAIALAALTLAITMMGCGSGLSGPVSSSGTVPFVQALSGHVHGGQQPVQGASVQMYVMNSTTVGGAATALLSTPATTDANGYFNITTHYTCPAGGFAYMVATGGNAGAGTNPAIALMSGMGPCSGVGPSTSVNVNEVTTAAAIYTLSPFMVDLTHVGFAGPSTIGIANAFAMMNALAAMSQPGGGSPGPTAATGTVIPTTVLNTVANILAACINGSSATCTNLFALTKSSANVTPSNTVNAMVNLAKNPTNNVSTLFNLIVGQSPFQPQLSSAPADWSLSVKVTGGSLNAPYGIAIDANGNAWVTNTGGFSVSKLGPQGANLSGANGFGTNAFVGPQGITIDPSGNLWVANTGAGTVVEMMPDGSVPSPTGIVTGTGPVDVAADARGMIWVANFGSSNMAELNNAGQQQGLFNANGSLSRPAAIAIGPTGNVWVSNSGTGTVTEFDKNATLLSSGNGWSDGALQGPAGIAVDGSSHGWVVGTGGPDLTGLTDAGASVGSAPEFTLAGAKVLIQPTGIAVDSAGTIFVANGGSAGSIAVFAAGTGTNTIGALGAFSTPQKIAVDPSGNVWIADAGDNSVTILVGVSAPTATPLVARTQ